MRHRSCLKATHLLSEAQERELHLGERVSLRVHLMMCRGCRRFGDQVSVLRQLARAYAQGAPLQEPAEPQA